MDADFCVEALDDALPFAMPEIFNTDQNALPFLSKPSAPGPNIGVHFIHHGMRP